MRILANPIRYQPLPGDTVGLEVAMPAHIYGSLLARGAIKPAPGFLYHRTTTTCFLRFTIPECLNLDALLILERLGSALPRLCVEPDLILGLRGVRAEGERLTCCPYAQVDPKLLAWCMQNFKQMYPRPEELGYSVQAVAANTWNACSTPIEGLPPLPEVEPAGFICWACEDGVLLGRQNGGISGTIKKSAGLSTLGTSNVETPMASLMLIMQLAKIHQLYTSSQS